MCKWGKYKKVKLCKPRENSGRIKIYVDSCISKLVQELNNHGVHTEGCCCGHFKGDGEILINSDSFEILNNGALSLKIKHI